MADKVELLFFDTFSHESSEELNLDLVQFPKPVFISEVRIIPLGARVQADFPGGVRLGATNPSQFEIEFFVNDLSKPGASSFESLGGLDYKQNGKIQLETACRQIPTDGLVLRGWYTTITLAVYGVLTKTIQEQIVPQVVLAAPAISGPVTPDAPAPPIVTSATAEWVQQLPQVAGDAPYGSYGQPPAPPWPAPPDAAPPRKEPRRRSDKEPAPPPPATRRRPRTPPKPEEHQGSERTQVKKEALSPPPALSPGDVESISDTEISDKQEPPSPAGPAPVTPPAPVAVVTPQQQPPPPPQPMASPQPAEDTAMDVEQFEPILSDEEIVDETDPMQFQDMEYDFNDEEEASKTFNPFTVEFQQMLCLSDPSEAECEADLRRGTLHDEAAQLSELLERAPCAGEEWVNTVEQVPALLAKALPSLVDKTDVLDVLVGWVTIGLDFAAAVEQPQPGYKVRHLKAGIRLTEALCQCGERFTLRLLGSADVHNKLVGLFRREYMALSIKLMILKALDTSLSWKASVDRFLGPRDLVKLDTVCAAIGDSVVVKQEGEAKRILQVPSVEGGGYRTLVELCLENQLARVKFALNSLLRKLHVYEVLSVLRGRVARVARNEAPGDEDVEVMAACLEQVARVYKEAPALLAQPKRFLPVAAQFEIGADSGDPYPALYAYFRAHCLLECALVLLSSPHTLHLSPIVCPAQELLSALLERPCGQRFLLACAPVSTALVRLLLGEALDEAGVQAPLQRLGLRMAYRLQALQLIDALLDTSGLDPDHGLVLDQLHALYSLGCTAPGRLALAHVLSAGSNITALLKLFTRSARPTASPGRAYAADLIVLTVKLSDNVGFLLRHGRDILRAAATQEGGRLHEAAAWLKPLEAGRCAYDQLSALTDTLQRCEDSAAMLPGEMITALRVLRHLGVEEGEHGAELKYRYVILQLYAADGVTRLCSALSAVCGHYEQPALHACTLAGAHGLHLASMVLPAVQLLRAMLAQAVQARSARHKDLTSVPALLATYTLMQAYPAGAWGADDAARACAECVDALLAFTQGASEADALNKSLWTMMVAQVVKFVTTGPQTFVPGLLVLSEMLPLPLPVHARSLPPAPEAELPIHARKLWSAHLHPLSSSIHDVITTLSSSGFPPLLQLLRRVCVQLADLAAPTALAVTRALLDPLPAHLGVEATPHAARLLNFLACMASHAPVKACLVQLLTGAAPAKGDDKYPALVGALCDVLTRVSSAPSHVQAQECVIAVMQCLCDVETSLAGPEVSLCNALPGRDLLVTMATALLDHLANPEQGSTTLLPAARTLLVLGEHDYTLYHLRACVSKCGASALRALFTKLCAGFSAANNTVHCAIGTSLEFLRVCLSCEGFDEARTLAITLPELAAVLDWRRGEDHPVTRLEQLLQECAADEEGLESLHESVACLSRLLEEESSKPAEPREWVEPVLPPADTLLAQFSARPVFQLGEVEEERLSSSYWLAPPPSDDLDQDLDQVACDLMELSREVLPELALAAQAEQLCRAKAGAPSVDNDDVDLIKKRGDDARFLAAETRNKRPFVAPMRGRGFGRAAPQRGDLFRSRPPNTSRPPSLHVDDFVALESSGQQPTGPTGYNKLAMRAAKDMIGARGRGRGRAFPSERGRFFPLPTSYRRENGCGGLQRGAIAQRGCNGAQAWTDGVATANQFEARDMRVFPRSEDKFPVRFGRGLRAPAWPLKDHRERFGGPNNRGLPRREPLRHTRTFTR